MEEDAAEEAEEEDEEDEERGFVTLSRLEFDLVQNPPLNNSQHLFSLTIIQHIFITYLSSFFPWLSSKPVTPNSTVNHYNIITDIFIPQFA